MKAVKYPFVRQREFPKLLGMNRKKPQARSVDGHVRTPELTRREREIITLVGEGLKNKEIAARLCISEGTVRTHLTSIFTKLGVPDRLKLIVYAYRHGLVELPK